MIWTNKNGKLWLSPFPSKRYIIFNLYISIYPHTIQNFFFSRYGTVSYINIKNQTVSEQFQVVFMLFFIWTAINLFIGSEFKFKLSGHSPIFIYRRKIYRWTFFYGNGKTKTYNLVNFLCRMLPSQLQSYF